MNDERKFSTDEHSVGELKKALEEDGGRDGVTGENRDEKLMKSVEEFIDKFSAFCAHLHTECRMKEGDIKNTKEE